MLPLVELDGITAVVSSALAWATLGIAVGYATHRLPVDRLSADGWFTRLAAFEQDGRWYRRRLHINRWKDRLPEAGGVFAGGVSKRTLPGHTHADLERFVIETRRAELTHWVLLLVAPLFFLWNPPWLGFVMVGYALVANVPCLVVQRYNRSRLLRMLARPAAHRDAEPPRQRSSTDRLTPTAPSTPEA
jgi:glycosyl-4,4'-diaponeurosporenoate acyltransferase